MESPIDGIVTRRNIQEGETAVIGTMNNAGTVLLSWPTCRSFRPKSKSTRPTFRTCRSGRLAKITIDAIPDKSFKGHVTEIGNSPIQAAAGAAAGTQATNFKVVVVLDEQVPDVRPGFTCTADITTATRKNVTAVPIPAVAVRELIYDANGQVMKEPQHRQAPKRRPSTVARRPPSSSRADAEGNRRRLRAARRQAPNSCRSRWESPATSTSRCWRAEGGDEVITGPYNSVRGMADGDLVKVGQQGEEVGHAANRWS